MNQNLRRTSSSVASFVICLQMIALLCSCDRSTRTELQQADRQLKEMSLEAKDPPKIQLRGLTLFELGATHSFDKTTQAVANEFRPTSLTFMPIDDKQRFRETWPHPELVAEMRFPPKFIGSSSGKGNLLLVLYDAFRLPLYASSIPEAAITSNTPATDKVLNSLWERHRLWLRPADDPVPSTTYSFHLQDDQVDVTLPSTKEVVNRGITFSCALDAFRKTPDKWRVPIAFSADWNGRTVHVLGVTGPSFGQVFGSGLDGRYVGGYAVTNSRSVLLVINAITGFPLLERSESMEFQFHDYVEATPGQFAPLRILCRSESMQMDLRFQIADQKLWTFERKAESEWPAFVDNLRIDGATPASLQRSESRDSTEPLPEFPWEQLTNRQAIRSNDSISACMATSEKPWTHPVWEAVNRLSIETDLEESCICRLQSRPWIGTPHYWSLTLLNEDRPQALSCAETLSAGDATSVAAMLLHFDQTTPVPGQPDFEHTKPEKTTSNKSEEVQTHVLGVNARRDGMGDILLKPEILSKNWLTDQSMHITAVLVNSDGVAIRGGTCRDSFRTYEEPVLRQDCEIALFGIDNFVGTSTLIGCHSVVTGMPMGSIWGTLMMEDPLFQPENLLGSRFAAVRHVGLQQIYRTEWQQLTRQFGPRFHSRDEKRAVKELVPHKGMLKSVLSNNNGDADEALAIACRLAGFSQDAEFAEQLRVLLNHKSEQVQDSAAIGLGLLGSADGLTRLRELAAIPIDELSPKVHPYADRSIDESRWALERAEK